MFFACTAAIAAFSACSADHFESENVVSAAKTDVVDNPFAISADEAIAKADEIIGSMNNVFGLRSASDKVVSDVKTSTVDVPVEETLDSEASKQSVPLYTISYQDKDGESVGSVLLVGDERLPDDKKIIALSANNAELDLSSRSDADFLSDRIEGYLFYKINHPELNTSELDHNNTDAIQLRTVPVSQSGPTWSPLWVLRGWSSRPFNRYSPYLIDTPSNFASVPGVALVMGEIMAFHKWPTTGTFKRYSYSGGTSTLQTVTVSYSLSTSDYNSIAAGTYDYYNCSSAVTDYISNLLIEIGYRLNTAYSTVNSTALPSDAPAVFQAMGFYSTSLYSYNSDSVYVNVANRNLPVFLSAKSYGASRIHSYMISKVGVSSGSVYYYTQYANNTDATDAWFLEEIFSDPSTFNALDIDRYFPFIYECNIITSIRKNPNISGCTNANWRVRSTNPY